MEDDAIMQSLTDEPVETSTSTDGQEEAVVETVETEETDEAVETTSEETETEESANESEEQEEEEAEAEIDPKEQARIAYQQRQAEKAAKQAKIQEAQAQHLNDAQDEQDLALRQLQIDAYTNKVENNTSRLQNQYEKAVNDIEIFRNPTTEVQQELDAAIDEFQERFVQIDEFGNPVNVGNDLYQFLAQRANSIMRWQQMGAKSEKAGQAKQRSAVTPKPAGSPRTPKVDPIMAVLLED